MAENFQLNEKEKIILKHLGELILGVPREELGLKFLDEAELFIANLDAFLISDLRRLLKIFNSRVTSLLFCFSLKPFTKMGLNTKTKLYNKWVHSKIGLLRTGASTLKALCGWSYYSTDQEWDKMNYPGIPLGREDETPTLLEGKQPWEPNVEVDEI